MARYLCTYTFWGGAQSVESTEGIGAFKDGFWINDALEYTKGSDCKYWVPPGRILVIQKLEEGKDVQNQ